MSLSIFEIPNIEEMTHQFTQHIGTFRKKKIDCPDALEVVLVIEYWNLFVIWCLLFVI